MKKLLIVLAIATAISGCEKVVDSQETKAAEQWVYHGRNLCTKVVELDGHMSALVAWQSADIDIAHSSFLG